MRELLVGPGVWTFACCFWKPKLIHNDLKQYHGEKHTFEIVRAHGSAYQLQFRKDARLDDPAHIPAAAAPVPQLAAERACL